MMVTVQALPRIIISLILIVMKMKVIYSSTLGKEGKVDKMQNLSQNKLRSKRKFPRNRRISSEAMLLSLYLCFCLEFCYRFVCCEDILEMYLTPALPFVVCAFSYAFRFYVGA